MPETTIYTQIFSPVPEKAPSGKRWYLGISMIPIRLPEGTDPERAFMAYAAWKSELLWGEGSIGKMLGFSDA